MISSLFLLADFLVVGRRERGGGMAIQYWTCPERQLVCYLSEYWGNGVCACDHSCCEYF